MTGWQRLVDYKFFYFPKKVLAFWYMIGLQSAKASAFVIHPSSANSARASEMPWRAMDACPGISFIHDMLMGIDEGSLLDPFRKFTIKLPVKPGRFLNLTGP
jgi:hypothetical protein